MVVDGRCGVVLCIDVVYMCDMCCMIVSDVIVCACELWCKMLQCIYCNCGLCAASLVCKDWRCYMLVIVSTLCIALGCIGLRGGLLRCMWLLLCMKCIMLG